MRFSFAESMTDPSYYLPAGAGGRGGRLRLHGRARQHLLPRGVRHHLPLQPRRHPGVPRGQALPGALLHHPRHGGGDRAPALRHLRHQVADPPAGARQQAGQLHRRAHEQPPAARRRHQPVARGLRDLRRALGAPRHAHGRGDRHHARSHGRRLLRVPRQGVRRALHQDVPDAEPARADPDRRAPRGRPEAGRRRRGRLAARRGRPGRPARAAGPPGRAAPGARHRVQALRDARDLARRLHARRRPAPRGARRHRRHRRLPLALRVPSRTPSRCRRRSTT